MLQTFKYRIYPNETHQVKMAKHFGCARFIYNWGLALRIKEYQENGKTLSRFDLTKRITQLKKELPWLADVQAQTLQSSMLNLDAAYTAFFRKIAKFPKFKSKHKSKNSFQYPQNVRCYFENNMVYLPKIGNVTCVFDRNFEGKIKTVTISKIKTNKYFASVLVETPGKHPKPKKPRLKSAVGIDLGIKHFATLSTGEKIENPRYLEKAERRIKHYNRKFSKTQKGSKRREKARLKLALLHEKVTNKRNDFLHKLSTRLVRENQTVCLEDLSISEMMKNSWFAKHISSVAWGRFIEFLKYKAEREGKNILQLNRFEPSSKICSCGIINTKLKLSQRTWNCESCGASHDRDVLAAQNIKKFAFNKQNLIKNIGLG